MAGSDRPAGTPSAASVASSETSPGDDPLSTSEIRGRATKGALLLTLRGVGIRAIALASNLVIARLMLPSEIGLVAIGASVVAFGDFLANAGIASPLIRRREAPDSRDLESVVGFQVLVTLSVGAAAAAIGVPLGRIGQVAAVMVASLPILAFRTPSVIVLERRLSYGRLVVVELLDALVYAAWAVGAVLLGFGVWGLATAVVVRSAIGTGVLAVLSPVGLPRPRLSWARIRPILGFGVRFQAIGAVNMGRDQGFNFLVAAVGGLTVLGFWTLAYRVLQTLYLVFQGLWRVSFPAMSRLIEAGEDPRPIIERSVGVVALGSGVFLATLAGCAPALIPAVVGERWSEAADIMPAACLALMIGGPVSVAVAGYLFASGDAGTPLRATILHTGAQFAVAAALLPSLGAWALGLGWLAAALIDALVLGRAGARLSGARILPQLAVPLLAATAAGAAGWALATAGSATIPLAALSGALSLGIFLAAMATFRRGLLVDSVRLVRRGLRRPEPGPEPAGAG